MKRSIDLLESSIGDPSRGLPEDVFFFVSGITPLVNVDLLIKNSRRQTLLVWRDDGLYPAGWHVPGGIVRFKEKATDRIKAVAAAELGTEVRFRKEPLAVNEVIEPARRVRGHFISFLYECRLIRPPAERLRHKRGALKPGQWAWHTTCPSNIIPVHEMYRKFLT
jgi:colanic acid biosynthesis protein WcaH